MIVDINGNSSMIPRSCINIMFDSVHCCMYVKYTLGNVPCLKYVIYIYMFTATKIYLYR